MNTTYISTSVSRPPVTAPAALVAAIAICAFGPAALGQSDRVVITPQPGYAITWDGNNGGFFSPDPGVGPTNNPALAANGTVAFGSSEVGLNVHFIMNVNDGYYGNSSSWIPDFINGDTNAFIGLNFGQTVALESIAWGRDNGDTTEPGCANGTCLDRCVGIYTLQVTTVANPGVDTVETGDAATGWATIGTVEYTAGADTHTFSAYLRHRFDVATADAKPIPATGLRIKVSDPTMDIDEIEVNPGPDPIPPLANFLVLAPEAGYNIQWDGNEGIFFDENAPARAPRSLASTATAFGSSEFGGGVHFIANVNDGLYGNSHSWIPNFTLPDPNPYVGLKWPAAVQLRSIAWSRDNGDNVEGPCAGGQCTDRALGTYTLQVTRVADPGTSTQETGDPATGWATIATAQYKAQGTPFTPYLRHRFDVAMADGSFIPATGLRIKVPDSGTAIDEIEVNVNAGQEQNLIVINADAGYAISWDGNDGDFYNPQAGARAPENDALAVKGATAFGSSELGFGIHFFPKVNDGFYGNWSSWISANGLGGTDDPDPFIGINFGKTVSISTLAWGRDNGDTTEAGCGGTCLDRWQGIYTLQVTTVANPGKETAETGDPATGWATIGTIEYVGNAPPSFNASRRHRFDLSKDGNPIAATGLRIKVSSGLIDLDEIEVNPAGVVVAPPVSDLLAITSAPGYSVQWDGNDGEYYTAGAPAPAPENLALASKGATAFGSSQLDFGVHFIPNVIDGLYGNSHSWIADFTKPDPTPFIGVKLAKAAGVRAVAWGRDNGDTTEGGCANGTCTDRALGTYTLQITRVEDPGVNTPETGDPSTGWVTVGVLEYKAAFVTLFNPHLRHRFSVAAEGLPVVLATGLRIKVSDPGMAIDEIEVNPIVTPDQNILVITPEAGYAITWDGNDGDFSSPAADAPVPNNAALAKNGSTAFGSSQLDFGVHFISNVNDGFYGNKHSWLPDFSAVPDPDPWIGVSFGKTVNIENVAWGRDNGDDIEGAPFTDRALGTYTLQVTTVANPGVDTEETGDAATGWATIGALLYRGAGSAGLHHYLRHSYGVSLEGNPIPATAFRIKVSSNQMAIDEIEVNTEIPTVVVRPTLSVSRQGSNLEISWTGAGILQSADEVTGPWSDVPGATASPQTVSIASGIRKFFRVKQ
jgi:hypothetical protein